MLHTLGIALVDILAGATGSVAVGGIISGVPKVSGAVFVVGTAKDVADTDRVLGFFKDPDQPGALGYHDLSPQGVPYGKVFPILDAQDGANLSTTTDHEGKELTEDDTINLARTGSDGAFWADECCDAVEQDEYTIDGVTLSNFVLPAWYSGVVDPTLAALGVRGSYDFLGKLTAPLTLTAGGYAQYYDPQGGWQQVTHEQKKPRPYRRRLPGRSYARRFGVGEKHGRERSRHAPATPHSEKAGK